MGKRERPHLEKNAPGAWYTTGECMACGAPEAEAPELFSPLTDEDLETYFARQPATPGEVERACRAAAACCVSAVRYGGQDRTVIQQLGNSPEYCDWVVDQDGRLAPGGPWPPAPPRWWQFWRRAAAS